MEEASIFLDVPSPSNAYLYTYGDHDQYLDTSHSETQSSATSPYDMTFPGDFTGSDSIHSSGREGEDGSQSPQESSPAASGTQPKPAAKRKRENRYKNAPPSVLSRRRAQNRASQRAYRERKDQRIKDLEQMLNDAKARNDVLSQAYTELHAEYVNLKTSRGISDHHHQAAAYSAAAGPTAGGYVDPTMASLHAGSDLDVYLYPEVGGYPM
ncbi:AP-1-like transcription factor CAP1 [Cytospora mali]|uniref:Putative transcription factor kapC n=1 Tax=Cytospora mali TaxID=578113 RepID=A0A194W8P4_CYTMA|nr:AP-1-like transcription factor CAP1 [Valsa mali]